MKFGAHSFIFTERWSDRTLGFLYGARELGLDCFEIGIGDDVQFSPVLTRRAAAAAGLELFVSPGGVWPIDYDLSAEDPEQRAAGLAWHKRQIDLAASIDATAYTGALYGHPGVVQRRQPRPDELAWTAESLFALADYAQTRDVRVVLEPMSHFRTHLVNTPRQALRLIGLTRHPNLRILLDTYHMVCEVRDYGEAIQTAAPVLWGLHACENDRGAPGGGLVPWSAVFQALREVAFDGYILMESYNSSIPGFAEGRGMLQDVCPSGAGFVRTGLAFLRQEMEKAAANHAGSVDIPPVSSPRRPARKRTQRRARRNKSRRS